MSTSEQMKTALHAVHGGISNADQSYRIGYAVAVSLSWIGIALAITGLVVGLWSFMQFVFGFFNPGLAVTAAIPGLSASLTGLGLVLAGQLARAIFDMSRATQQRT